MSLTHGVGSVIQHKMLLAGLVGREAHHHHVGGIRHKGLSLVAHPVGCGKAHRGVSRVNRQGTPVVADALLADICGKRQFAHGGEGAKAELWFACGLVGHGAVKVLGGELCGLVPVAVGKCLSYILEHMCRLFVLVPIVGSALGRVGTAAPQCLFIQRVALCGHTAHHIAAYAAIAQGQ